MLLYPQSKLELDILNPTATSPPNKTDILTPHKIAVALLIHQYLKIKQSNDDTNAPMTAQLIFASYSRTTRRKFCMLLLKLIQYPDMSYKDLHNMLTSQRYKIDEHHLESFEKCIEDLNKFGIENLLDLFDMQNVMDKILSDNSGINQYGIVGLYIRRVAVTLDKMSFPEMKALYKSINLYYEKGIRALAISTKQPVEKMESDLEEADDLFDSRKIYKDRNTQSKWSIKQAELFIGQQSSLLENNELKALPPIELQAELNEILQDNPLYSQAHFLTYMNNLRLRDYFNSVDSLYRTFDRNPVQSAGPNGNNSGTRGCQFSSLNLAIMHASYNHNEEALVSLKECIMLAQESGDKQCLDLANAWYCILNEKTITPLDKCLPDQNDLSMIELLTLGIQFVVKVASSCGYRPTDLFQMLLKSDKINSRNSLIEYTGSSLAMQAALWTLYGSNELSSVCSQMLLKLKKVEKTWFGDYSNSESVCQVLCSLGLWLSVQGEYDIAAVVLHHTKERFPRNPLSANWMICECHINISQAIYKCKWRTALKYCCQLYLFDQNGSILQRASVYIARRNITVARQLLDNLLEKLDLDSLTKVRALTLLAYSMIISENQISAQICTILSETAALSKDEYFQYDTAIIDMIFSYVLLNTSQPQKAFEVINNSLETILSNGGIYDKAKCYFLFIKCLIASTPKLSDKIEKLLENMDIINETISYFKKIENHAKVLDIYRWLSEQFNQYKMFPERNKYACKFKNYYNEFNTPTEYLNVFF